MKKLISLIISVSIGYFFIPSQAHADFSVSRGDGRFAMSPCSGPRPNSGICYSGGSVPSSSLRFSSVEALCGYLPKESRNWDTGSILYTAQCSSSYFLRGNNNVYLEFAFTYHNDPDPDFSDDCDETPDSPYCSQFQNEPDFRFPPGSPFCIDNPTSPLCSDGAPDGCNIGLGTGDCCTAFATNQCAGNGGVYWVNFTSGDFGEACNFECWGDQHNHPPEPDPGNHPGFPDPQSCQTFAENHCGGSTNLWMYVYNETEKTCSATCNDGRGGTSPDPTIPLPGGSNPGITPTPGDFTDLGVQRAIQRFHADSLRQWETQNRQQADLWSAGLFDPHNEGKPRLQSIEELLTEIRDKPGAEFDGELTIPGFDNLPGDFGDLDHDGDGMRGIGDGLGLDGDTTFEDIPERIIDISDYMGNFDLPSSGSCPTSFPVPLFGQVYNLDTSHMCRILEIVSIFLMMSAYVLSLRIVYGGLR